MIKETSGDCYEEARSVNQQLTFDEAEKYFAERNMAFGEQQKRTLNIIGADGTYTNLGMLLSDQCVHTIKLAVFNGSQKTIFRDRKELMGSLLKQLEEAYAYIDNFNHVRAEFEGLRRIDNHSYPAEALREALLNAITHRDYGYSASTLISIFDDRIEFVTVGGLVKGLSFDDIMLGVSVLRNKNLANVLYRLKLIEAYGTGILKINESYAAYDVKPQFEVSSNAFKIVLPNTNFETKTVVTETKEVTRPETREETVLRLAREKGYVIRKDVEEAFGISQTAATVVLRNMLAHGLLAKDGVGKTIKYYVTEK